jgi:hypothetical protein
MGLGLILAFFFVFIAAYSFWMAEQLGVGPRWGRSARDPESTPKTDPPR